MNQQSPAKDRRNFLAKIIKGGLCAALLPPRRWFGRLKDDLLQDRCDARPGEFAKVETPRYCVRRDGR